MSGLTQFRKSLDTGTDAEINQGNPMTRLHEIYAVSSDDTAHRVHMYTMEDPEYEEFQAEFGLDSPADTREGCFSHDKRGGLWHVKMYKMGAA